MRYNFSLYKKFFCIFCVKSFTSFIAIPVKKYQHILRYSHVKFSNRSKENKYKKIRFKTPKKDFKKL